MKNLIAYCLLSLLPLGLLAQISTKVLKEQQKAQEKASAKAKLEKLKKQEEEGTLIYQQQTTFGIKLNTDGYGLMFEKAKLKTAEQSNFWTLELGERKDGKEEKVQTGNSAGLVFGTPFIYGKQNNFFYLKFGFGESILLGGKGQRNGVAVSALASGGISIGLLKPYYLNIRVNNRDTAIKFMDNKSKSDSLFLDPASIISGGGFFKGIGETKIRPGLYAKTSLRFDYGRYNELVSAVEVGLGAEYYFSKMPLLLQNKQRNLFLNLFVILEFGKRK